MGILEIVFNSRKFDLNDDVLMGFDILKDMPCGYYAERKAQDDEWSVRKR